MRGGVRRSGGERGPAHGVNTRSRRHQPRRISTDTRARDSYAPSSPPLSSRAYSRPMRSRSFPSLPARIRTCYDAFDDDGKKFVRREKLCPADRSIGRDGGRDESGLFLARGETIAPLLFIKTAKHRVSQVKRLL